MQGKERYALVNSDSFQQMYEINQTWPAVSARDILDAIEPQERMDNPAVRWPQSRHPGHWRRRGVREQAAGLPDGAYC